MFSALNYVGGITPNTMRKAEEILTALKKYNGKELTYIWGKTTSGEHGTGRALDFMVPNDKASGDFIANYVWEQRNRLGLQGGWEIWQQRIRSTVAGNYGPAGQWNMMENRGNSTANHYDHVHVLFGTDAYTIGEVLVPPVSVITPPPFPLPAGWYFGPESGPRESVSGKHSYFGALKLWQERMRARGWAINVTGLYEPQTANITRMFQAEKGLGVDGLIGPKTWNAAWTAPVT